MSKYVDSPEVNYCVFDGKNSINCPSEEAAFQFIDSFVSSFPENNLPDLSVYRVELYKCIEK